MRNVEASVHRLAECREVDLAIRASHVVEERLGYLDDAPPTDSAAEQSDFELLERVGELRRDLRDEVRGELVDELCCFNVPFLSCFCVARGRGGKGATPLRATPLRQLRQLRWPA